jgi:hypothetical protein
MVVVPQRTQGLARIAIGGGERVMTPVAVGIEMVAVYPPENPRY